MRPLLPLLFPQPVSVIDCVSTTRIGTNGHNIDIENIRQKQRKELKVNETEEYWINSSADNNIDNHINRDEKNQKDGMDENFSTLSPPRDLLNILEKVRDLNYSSSNQFFQDLRTLRVTLTTTIKDARNNDKNDKNGQPEKNKSDINTAVMQASVYKVESSLLNSFDTLSDHCELYLKARSAAIGLIEKEICKLEEERRKEEVCRESELLLTSRTAATTVTTSTNASAIGVEASTAVLTGVSVRDENGSSDNSSYWGSKSVITETAGKEKDIIHNGTYTNGTYNNTNTTNTIKRLSESAVPVESKRSRRSTTASTIAEIVLKVTNSDSSLTQALNSVDGSGSGSGSTSGSSSSNGSGNGNNNGSVLSTSDIPDSDDHSQGSGADSLNLGSIEPEVEKEVEMEVEEETVAVAVARIEKDIRRSFENGVGKIGGVAEKYEGKGKENVIPKIIENGKDVEKDGGTEKKKIETQDEKEKDRDSEKEKEKGREKERNKNVSAVMLRLWRSECQRQFVSESESRSRSGSASEPRYWSGSESGSGSGSSLECVISGYHVLGRTLEGWESFVCEGGETVNR